MTIYLDNATTGRPKPEVVIRTVEKVMRSVVSSPGRGGGVIREADRVLFNARDNIGDFFNIESGENLVFTPNVTTSINLALKGILRAGDHVIISSLEHNAVVRPLRALEKQGITKSVVTCSPDGTLKSGDIEKQISSSTRMIIVIHASNVIGTITPIREIGRIAREHNILFLVDAAQTAGILPIDVERDNIDLLGCTGHKFLFGPHGTGCLYVRSGIEIEPLIHGGTGSSSESADMPDFLPDRFEAGTLNTEGIAGLSAGIDFIRQEGIDTIRKKVEELASLLWEGLSGIKGVKIYGSEDPGTRISVVSFNVEGRDPSEIGQLLNQKHQIICRVGLHCAPLAHKTIGTFPKGTVRVSVGYFNREEEIKSFLEVMDEIVRNPAS